MATTIATKADLQLLKQELTALITASVGELRQSIGEVRHEVRQEIALIRKDSLSPRP